DNPVPVSHEELMRGVAAGQEGAGKGSILDALKALHPAAIGSPAAYPPLPASAMPDSKPASKPVTKPAGKPAVKPGTHQPGPEATRQGRTPRRTRHSAKAAAPAKTKAEQIATAILLAKTGGQGQGRLAGTEDTDGEDQRGEHALLWTGGRHRPRQQSLHRECRQAHEEKPRGRREHPDHRPRIAVAGRGGPGSVAGAAWHQRSRNRFGGGPQSPGSEGR